MTNTTVARGFHTPQEGQQALGGNFTNWVLIRNDPLYYSPKDISGLPRRKHTPYHVVAALQGRLVKHIVLPKTRKRRD